MIQSEMRLVLVDCFCDIYIHVVGRPPSAHHCCNAWYTSGRIAERTSHTSEVPSEMAPYCICHKNNPNDKIGSNDNAGAHFENIGEWNWNSPEELD